MDCRSFLLKSIALIVARITLFNALIEEVFGADDLAELHALNCKSIDRYMTQTAINNTKYAKVCEAIYKGILLTPEQVTGCIADKLLLDDSLSKDIVEAACGSRPYHRSKRSFAFDFNYQDKANNKWPLPISYNISLNDTNSANTQQNIHSVISYIQTETCVVYVPYSQQPALQFLGFRSGDGCLSYYGRSEYPETVIVLQERCNSFNEILNLVTSSLGLADDSMRPDYVNYIYINTSNIYDSNSPIILPIPPYSTYNFPYDYASVLHAFPTQLSNNGLLTYRTYDPLYQNTIGQRVQLSFLDTKLINFIYCSDRCSGTTNNCEAGGYPDPLQCNLCKCPDGWASGDNCRSITPHDTSIDQCGQQIYDLSSITNGTVQSPGYDNPGYYDRTANKQCTWLLTAPVGSHVKITFLEPFGIYMVNVACYHWVEIRYNGSLNETGPRFCGDRPLAQTLKSKDNQMMILFRSFTSADQNYKGFKLRFEIDACTVVWSDPSPNTLTYGGTEVTGPLSKDGCLATCDITPWCYGVDIDYSGIEITKYPRCFMLSKSSLAASGSQGNGVVEYRVIQKCNITTTTTTTTTTTALPTTTTSTTTTIATTSSTMTSATMQQIATTSSVDACFNKLVGQQSSGATYFSSGQLVSACLSACLSSGCAGVDFVQMSNPSDTECWLYSDPQKLRDKYANPVVTQYINTCNASTTAKSTIMPTIATTLLSTAITTASTTTPTTTTTTTTTPTTTTTTTTTSTTASPTFNFGSTICPTATARQVGVQSSGATRNTSLQTETDCVNYCLATLTCLGVDVVTTTRPQECWVYTDASRLSQKYSNPGVVQYEITRTCAPVTTPGGAGCQNSWIIYNSSHSVGATKTSNPMLLSDCLNYCATNIYCVAVDYNSVANPVECWVHTNPANIVVRYSNSGLTQYVLSERCNASPSPPTPGCGGGNANPGELSLPCVNPIYPTRFCQQQIVTFVFQGGCWTQRIDTVSSPCVIYSCSGSAQLVTIYGTSRCVVTGWSGWSSCSASCGSFGVQRQYRYAVVNSQYITCEENARSCNNQACPCSGGGGCLRCCSGFYEQAGRCYQQGK